MRRTVAAALVWVAALVAAGLPAATTAAPACAAATGPRAGLVVDTGAATSTYCVALDAAEVSGLHLIELAHQQLGLTYSFGNGGLAVCRLNGVGPTGSDCFADYPEYWGYWHGDGAGGWTWASTGAGSARIGDGDIDGWVWGTGDSGATHDRPPALTAEDLCPTQASPGPKPTSSPEPRPTPTQSSNVPGGTQTTDPPSTSKTTPSEAEPPSSGMPTASSVGSTTPTSGQFAAAAGDSAAPNGGGGLPIGLILAVALGGLLVAGGVLRARSRSAPEGQEP